MKMDVDHIVQQMRKTNAQKAYDIINQKYNGDLKVLEDDYARRPYEHVWQDIKVLIDVSKTEEYKMLVMKNKELSL